MNIKHFKLLKLIFPICRCLQLMRHEIDWTNDQQMLGDGDLNTKIFQRNEDQSFNVLKH